MTTASASRGRPVDPALAPQFVRAALDIVIEQGYSGLTIAAVAKRAGASTASLYRRWPAKRDLVVDVARSLSLKAIGDVDTGSLRTDFHELLLRKERLFDEVGPAVLALMAEAHHDPELRDVLRRAVLGEAEQQASTILSRAAKRGEIETVPEATVRALGSLLLGGALIQGTLMKHDAERLRDATIEAELRLALAAVGYTVLPANNP